MLLYLPQAKATVLASEREHSWIVRDGGTHVGNSWHTIHALVSPFPAILISSLHYCIKPAELPADTQLFHNKQHH